ncbi:hypothetical protein C8A01DRAFT_13043 [Parachaetomium inaequale]|uniref:Uncharacterized protein n=1 Tax=Parachaetomium inaequale TaxID=2588326 RepID=A0AAN6PLY1_9PEZI|nr:hypothetical protein C8A01DRAFT_13043 [Parachaetomium inaequale]
MSSSLPVPSKAALTALRGLVVGTSCTLALIAEDRRRRINNAVRAIENGERIKAARGYRAGGASLAIAIEEEALWDPRFGPVSGIGLELHRHDNTGGTSSVAGENKNQSLGRVGEDEVEALAETSGTGLVKSKGAAASEQHEASNTTSADSSAQPGQLVKPPKRRSVRPRSKLTPAPNSGPSWALANTEVVKAYTFPTIDEIVVKVHQACNTKDARQLAATLRTALEAMDHRLAPPNLNRPWIEATARLCRTCQEEGQLDDAATLLYRIICRGPLEESDYLSHEPFALIEALLARAELNKETRDVYAADIDSAVNLFVPKFLERPTGANPQVYSLGRRLLKHCFSANRLQRVFGIYRRCTLVAEDNWNDLASWFLRAIHERQDYTSVVKIFITSFAQSSPTEASVHAIGDLVVDSVELSNNHRPEEVLETLHTICTSLGTRLNPKWVMRLFLSHWRKHKKFHEIEAMFEKLHTPKLKNSVFRSDNIYRIMVELALEAGEEAKADSYLMRAVAQNRALASDVRLLGVVARFHAADGDWGAVRDDFEAMNQNGTPSGPAYGQVFIPVLKAYAETHTVCETEAFLKSYVDELKVPLCSYMVTLMAKQYAAIRDVGSLIDWLDYCSRADFPVDAAFTNAILVRCRRQWNFPFRELRTLFRKLQALNPDCVDKHTEQVMADAALSDSKYGGKAARGRLLSLRLDPVKPPGRSKHAQAEDVIPAMKEALRNGSPRRAVKIYRRAVHTNMPFSAHALHLAVQAHLAWAPTDFDTAYALLRKAQSKGEDINPNINYLLGKQLDALTSSITNPQQADHLIQETLTQYRRAGIQLTETSLHRAAALCLTAGHPRGAIRYALSAAAARDSAGTGSAEPCFNLRNFRLLLAAYAELVDADGLRDTIARGLADSSHYREDAACRRALKHARARVVHSRARAVSQAERMRAGAVVEEGIGRVVEARRKLRDEGRVLEAEAVRIMRRAALDAGREEVDFGEVPWLGGGERRRRTGGGGGDTGEGGGGGGFFEDGGYGELERSLLEGSAGTAVEAF